MAIESYVSHTSYQAPELAAPFVNERKGDQQRFSTAQNLASYFLSNDPVVAEKWIGGLNLSEDQKRQLLKLKPQADFGIIPPPRGY